MSSKLIFRFGIALSGLFSLSFLILGFNGYYSNNANWLSLQNSLAVYLVLLTLQATLFLIQCLWSDRIIDWLRSKEDTLLILDQSDGSPQTAIPLLWKSFALINFCASLFLFIAWFDFRLPTISNLSFAYALLFVVLGWTVSEAPSGSKN